MADEQAATNSTEQTSTDQVSTEQESGTLEQRLGLNNDESSDTDVNTDANVERDNFIAALPDAIKRHPAMQHVTSAEEFLNTFERLRLPDEPVTTTHQYKPREQNELDQAQDAFIRTWASELKLNKDQAQQMRDSWGTVMDALTDYQTTEFEQFATESSQKIKEDLGANYVQRIKSARNAAAHFGGDEFIQFLDSSGLIFIPELMKTFVAIGEAMQEDRYERGNPAPRGAAPSRFNERLGVPMIDFDAVKPKK